ncbi:MAG: RluA family pseudouridine synthase [Alphaproteobacteria bacterium]|nr:RluA family pseudouridine synthase [Alphaproteobacteria bacterium]
MTSNNKFIFIVEDGDAGIRVDKFVASKIPEYSRSEIQKFQITKNGNEIKLSDKVKVGEEYEVIIPEKKPVNVKRKTVNETMSLDIVYEDADIIVINKPRGIAMYPGAGREDGTLVQAVLAHTELSSIGADGMRPGVVHRLDKDTSGVIVFAKTDAAHRVLSHVFSEHNLVRKYIAFVWGVPNWLGADISGNIGRSTRNRQKMTMLKTGGKPAKTHAEVINVWPRTGISELRCTLETGRTHQIRVHLSAHGFPVLCDPIYGRGQTRLGSVKNPELLEFIRAGGGQMLHAEVLELSHPITGEMLKFKAKLPDDMRELKEILNDM